VMMMAITPSLKASRRFVVISDMGHVERNQIYHGGTETRRKAKNGGPAVNSQLAQSRHALHYKNFFVAP
jgi:hypothetical protein